MFCFGLGYVGAHVARTLQAKGWSVAGTTRCEEHYHKLELEGIEPHFFRFGHASEQVDRMLAGTTHLLITIPPGDEGDPVYNECRLAIGMLPDLQWLGYLSTTGVYGDHHGGWVNETSPMCADNERVERRVAAERYWLGLHDTMGIPAHIFRLSAIYGPGRSAFDALREGRARCIMKEGQVFSRIHVEDITRTLLASIDHPDPGEIYNLADDCPSPQHEVVRYAAELIGGEPPAEEAYESAQMSEMMREFYSSSRKVRNNKIKAKLGVELAYPDYKVGLRAILALEE